MNSAPTVPALLYDVTVYSPLLPFNSAGDSTTKEIFIPSVNIIINAMGGFSSAEKPRNISSHRGVKVERTAKEIQLPYDYVEKIRNVAKLKLEVEQKETEVKRAAIPYFNKID